MIVGVFGRRVCAAHVICGCAERCRDPDTVTDADVASLVIAGWSMCHGYATLMATHNLADRASGDLLRGVELLASLLGNRE